MPQIWKPPHCQTITHAQVITSLTFWFLNAQVQPEGEYGGQGKKITQNTNPAWSCMRSIGKVMKENPWEKTSFNFRGNGNGHDNCQSDRWEDVLCGRGCAFCITIPTRKVCDLDDPVLLTSQVVNWVDNPQPHRVKLAKLLPQASFLGPFAENPMGSYLGGVLFFLIFLTDLVKKLVKKHNF